jgi:hypothetical protein
LELTTTSAIISFYNNLEDKVVRFYEELATNENHISNAKVFRTFADDSKKQKDMVNRRYREVITDAFETGFSFSGLNEDDYQIDTELTDDLTSFDVLKMAINIEDTLFRFCTNASKSSKVLLTDIAQVLESTARKKAERKKLLIAL